MRKPLTVRPHHVALRLTKPLRSVTLVAAVDASPATRATTSHHPAGAVSVRPGSIMIPSGPAPPVDPRPAAHVDVSASGKALSEPQSVADAGQVDPQQQREQWESLRALFETMELQVEGIEQNRRRSLDELQEAAIELAVAVASHVTHEKINRDEYAIETIVARVIAGFQAQEAVVIRLHPDDLTLLKTRTNDLGSIVPDASSVTFVADRSLARGDCRADGPEFGVLANMELQLSEIRQHLLECLEHAQIERRRTQPGDRNLRRFPDRRETA